MITLRNVTKITLVPQFGWIQDPADTANKDLSLATSPIANAQSDVSFVDLTQYFKEVSDQLQFPSCTANAGADAWEAMCVIDKVNKGMSLQVALDSTPNFSRMFLWWCGRNEMDPNKTLDATSGCYNRLIMDVVARHGVPSEDLWPYDNAAVGPNGEARPIVRPSLKAFRSAYVNTCDAFYTIKETGGTRHTLIKKALSSRHVVVFGTSLSSAFTSYSGGVIKCPTLYDKIIGRHAMVIVGWSEEKNAYKVRNSWTKYWGEDGYCWMDVEYVCSPYSSSFWVITKGAL